MTTLSSATICWDALEFLRSAIPLLMVSPLRSEFLLLRPLKSRLPEVVVWNGGFTGTGTNQALASFDCSDQFLNLTLLSWAFTSMILTTILCCRQASWISVLWIKTPAIRHIRPAIQARCMGTTDSVRLRSPHSISLPMRVYPPERMNSRRVIGQFAFGNARIAPQGFHCQTEC